MIASDLADMYLRRRAGETVADVLQAVCRCAGRHGWTCKTRACTAPPFLPPLGDGDFVGVVVEPMLPASMYAHVVGGMVGEGRDVRLPYFDALLRTWRLSGSEWGFAQRGLTLHDLFDAQVALEGSHFAVPPNLRPTPHLYFGPPPLLVEMFRHQSLADRGEVLVFERVLLQGHDKAANTDGPMLAGTVPLSTASDDCIVAVIEDARHGHHRLIQDAFIDLDAARAAWSASNESPSHRVLFGRLVLRESL